MFFCHDSDHDPRETITILREKHSGREHAINFRFLNSIQKQFSPLPFSKQILIIMAGTGGFLDDMPVDQVRDFEAELYKYVESTNPGILRAIMEKKILDDQLKTQLQNVIKEAKQQFAAQREAVAK